MRDRITELFCTKKVYNHVCRLSIISWQECGVFSEMHDFNAVLVQREIDEIRQLIDKDAYLLD